MEVRGMRLQAFSLIFIIISSSSFAQRCETAEYYKKYPVTNSITSRTSEDKNARDTIANEVITVPVVIHVLYHTPEQNISDAQILSQLQALNNDYRKLNVGGKNIPAAFGPLAADARIIFCLAKVDASGKSTTGIIRRNTSTGSWQADDGMKYSIQGGDNAWDSKKYLNIWVCNFSGKSLGYSSLPGSQADRDGIVVQYNAFGTAGSVIAPFNKGRTLTHEVGHWLGLKHLWGDADCGDDGIADTPPQQGFNNGCPSFPHKTACSINGNGDMFMNFMDFSDDGCMYLFTKGQAAKMRSLFALGGARNSFLNSNVCDSSSVQRTAVPASQPVTGATITLFPNPAIKFISLESKTGDVVGKTMNVCNMYGTVVLSQVLASQRTNIAIQQLPPGIYFLKIGNDNKILRFIKE